MNKQRNSDDRVVALKSAEQIEDEAASWLMVLCREEPAREEVAAFQRWLSQNPRHQEAFKRLSAVWDDFGALTVLDDYAASVEAAVPQQGNGFGRRTMLGMAASVALAMIGGGAIYVNWSSGKVQNEAFQTAIGEQETMQLSDGSNVYLNTNTEMVVEYSRRQRSVRLLRGEAHFDVEKDHRRPFEVEAGEQRVTAIGTAFTVRLDGRTKVEVVVEEGRVALSPNLPGNKPSDGEAVAITRQEITVGGHAVSDGTDATITQMTPADIARKLSWRQGVLAYAGEPLRDVVADISRYTDIAIEISDPDLAARPIGGYFKVGDVEEMFESLELNFGVTVERVDEKRVRLSIPS